MTKHALIDRIYGNKDNARFWLAIDRLRAAMCREEQRRTAEQTQSRAKLALADIDHSLRLDEGMSANLS